MQCDGCRVVAVQVLSGHPMHSSAARDTAEPSLAALQPRTLQDLPSFSALAASAPLPAPATLQEPSGVPGVSTQDVPEPSRMEEAGDRAHAEPGQLRRSPSRSFTFTPAPTVQVGVDGSAAQQDCMVPSILAYLFL